MKGGKWYSLIDKVWNETTLKLAAWAVIRNAGAPGIDHRTTEQLEAELSTEVAMLSRRIREDTYQPQPVKRVWIEKPGSVDKRPLGIPVVRDRVVQGAVRAVIEPIFEHEFAPQSYGFRPGRSAQQAIARIEQLLGEGYVWVVDADLKSYFDTIEQDQLLARIEEKISDGRILQMIKGFLKQGVMDTAKGWQPTERGTPQGAVLSPLLANIYLNPLDHEMAEQGYEMIRYADDFIVLCRTEAEAQRALAQVGEWVRKAGLTLHPDKTRLVDARQPGGFDFLGWHFERGQKRPRDKSVARLKESLRKVTPRNSGQSLGWMIERINHRLKGWAAYFRGGTGDGYRRVDQWVRMRLRSVLRGRVGRKGIGHGRDHQRYPNVYFADHGLISLNALACGQRASPA
ncbi:MAG: group II intron reverse transcriptase/maturase [Verrucomicrobia bacterium]|nr:group II intron reverse transcriptase/maturase [Verrucomicrobiota bacterium]